MIYESREFDLIRNRGEYGEEPAISNTMMHDTEALNRRAEFAMKAIPDRKDPIAVTMVEAQWLFWPGEGREEGEGSELYTLHQRLHQAPQRQAAFGCQRSALNRFSALKVLLSSQNTKSSNQIY